jgi:hypothetical protein
MSTELDWSSWSPFEIEGECFQYKQSASYAIGKSKGKIIDYTVSVAVGGNGSILIRDEYYGEEVHIYGRDLELAKIAGEAILAAVRGI